MWSVSVAPVLGGEADTRELGTKGGPVQIPGSQTPPDPPLVVMSNMS